MRTEDQIKKKISKLERRLKLLDKYKSNVNFDVLNVSIPVSDHEAYQRDIERIKGKIHSLELS